MATFLYYLYEPISLILDNFHDYSMNQFEIMAIFQKVVLAQYDDITVKSGEYLKCLEDLIYLR